MERKFENLGKPFQIGKVTVKNRFAMAPMGGNSHYRPQGGFSDNAIEYFTERARGGFGLIYTGAIATDYEVDPYSAIGNSPLLTPDAFRQSAAELNERVNTYGTKIFAQLTMGLGRNYPDLPAPSHLPVYGHPELTSPELTKEQIKIKIDALVRGAKLMKASGFAGVEVHSIHWGYLLDQFALSMMNHRIDEYGGSLENRLRAAKEILEGIKQECGDSFPVSMRLGLKTYVKDFGKADLSGEEEKGRTLEEGIRIAKYLESYGYDVLSVDTGIYDSFYYACPPMYMPKGYMTELAGKAKEAVTIPVLAGGRMNDPEIAENAVREGKIDGIVLGRAALADPFYPNKVLSGHTEEIRPCIACNQGCITRLQQGLQPSCAVNPAAMREGRFALKPSTNRKKVVIVGGGAAGMETARTAAIRGHQVTLFEKSGSLGGNLIPGGSHSFKKEVRELNGWYQLQLNKLGVHISMNTEVSAEDLKKMAADVIVLAAGASPVMPKVEGINHPMVKTCIEALSQPEGIGDTVVVVGGGLVGCEMALEYAEAGKRVTIVEATDRILSAGAPSPIPNRQMLEDLFEKYKVNIMTGCMMTSVCDGKITVRKNGDIMDIPADTVVIAVGFRPEPSMSGELTGNGAAVYEIGDGRKVSTILGAVWDGYEIANNI